MGRPGAGIDVMWDRRTVMVQSSPPKSKGRDDPERGTAKRTLMYCGWTPVVPREMVRGSGLPPAQTYPVAGVPPA